MGLLVCSVLIPGELEEVFRFHQNPDNIGRVQPPGFKPSTVNFPSPLQVGSECAISVPTPMGTQDWRIRIEKLFCKPDRGFALMVDRALQSPFPFWVHRHCFEKEGNRTRMTDVVDFDPPMGRWGILLTPFVWIFLRLLFAIRHLRTVRLFNQMRAVK